MPQEVPWNWDERQSQDGLVNQSVPNTDHDNAAILKQGYDYEDFGEITPAPVACWPLHEDSGTTAHDVAGTNDATVNDATLGATGLLGTSAYSFDGVDDYVSLPNDLSTSPTGTVIGWVFINNTGNNEIFHSVNYNDSDAIYFGKNSSDDFAWWIRQDGSWIEPNQALGPTFGGGQWHQVGISSDGSTIRAIIDGGFASHTLSNSFWWDNVGSVASWDLAVETFGGNGKFVNGRMAGWRVYDVGLSESQIQAHYDVVSADGTWTSTEKTA